MKPLPPNSFERAEDPTLALTLLESSIESLKNTLIFSIDRDYNYLNFNTAFKDATMHAYGTEVKKGISMLDTIIDEAEKAKAKYNVDLSLSGQSHTTVEVYGVLNPSYFETTYSPMRNAHNEVVGVTILSTDVTEKKLAEDQIKALNKELEAFSYSVAHDLRAPLRIIDGYSGVLMEDHLQSLNAECQQILKIISGNVIKMNRLIEDLLEFARLGRLPVMKSKVNMKKLIEGILEEQARVYKHPQLELRLGQIENLSVDASLISQVFSNLISNALKYSRTQKNPIIEINSIRDGDTITYTVRDNGVGFDMAYSDKLFEVFQRLHRDSEFEGTGVGLAIVQRIVAKHGGKIRAEGQIGEGATFFVTFPA